MSLQVPPTDRPGSAAQPLPIAPSGVPVAGQRALFRVVREQDGHRIAAARLVGRDDLLHQTAAWCTAGALVVATDPFAYRGIDQVIPLQPEQLFVLDELQLARLQGARLVELGVGSGVLSIGALQAGAARVVALEINPRAIALCGFNAVVNGVEDRLEVRTGSHDTPFAPLAGERFDYLIANPPFEPTPPGLDYYLNSSAGGYGLDCIERILPRLEEVLTARGHAQIVTMAPGTAVSPTRLLAALETYLPGRAVTVRLDRQPIGYGEFLSRFDSWVGAGPAVRAPMFAQAGRDGITHLHLCMIHFTAGEAGTCRVVPTERRYEDWTTPLGSGLVDARLGVSR